MAHIDKLLGVDFDGNPVSDFEDVILEGLIDSRHRDRVPALVGLMKDSSAQDGDRLMACVALTTWAERAGYDAVIKAALDPKRTPWYDALLDRMYSVDNTFAQLAIAVDNSEEISVEKGTSKLRTEVLRALVRIADTEYFDGRLEFALDEQTIAVIIDDLKDVIRRGISALTENRHQSFDLPTQLVDLAGVAALVDGHLGVELGIEIVSVAPQFRTLNHAIGILGRVPEPESREFGEYLKTIGDEEIRRRVTEALQ